MTYVSEKNEDNFLYTSLIKFEKMRVQKAEKVEYVGAFLSSSFSYKGMMRNSQ